jgi:Zn ribbon nucleic-acid-binding protein
MATSCEHKNTTIIARRDGVDYVECVDCRQIFEAEDLEPVTVEAEEEEPSQSGNQWSGSERLPYAPSVRARLQP